MSSAEADVVVVVAVLLVVVSMVVDRDVVVALAKMEAGSGMKSASAAALWARWCRSRNVGMVGVDNTEGRAGLEGIESDERRAPSCSPGVDKGAAMPRVDADGVSLRGCGVCACVGGDNAKVGASCDGDETGVAAVYNTQKKKKNYTITSACDTYRPKQTRTCLWLGI